jgi:hypothetical protein
MSRPSAEIKAIWKEERERSADRPLFQQKYKFRLFFGNNDGVGFANFDAGFATDAVFGANGIGFAVGHFINVDGADIHAFGIAGALVIINNNAVTHDVLLKYDDLRLEKAESETPLHKGN